MKKISFLLCLILLLSVMPMQTFAETDFDIYLYDNFETVDIGRHPLYKDGYWTGDSLRQSYCGYLDVVRENQTNKALRIHSKGAGDNIGAAGAYIYSTLKNIKGDVVVECDITPETSDSVVNIDFRGETSSNIINILKMEGGVASSESKKIADYKIGEKTHLAAVIYAKTSSMDVTVNGNTVTGIKIKSPLIQAFQMARFALNGSTEKGRECGCLYDNVKIYQSSYVRPESDFAKTAQNLDLRDWSDLTTFFEKNICFIRGSRDAAVGLDRTKLDGDVYFDDGNVYSPVDFTLDNLGIKYTKYSSYYEMSFNKETITLSIGHGLKVINGKLYLDLKYLNDNYALYLSVRNNVAFFGRHLVCWNTDNQSDEIEKYVTNTQSVREDVTDWYPTEAQIRNDFENCNAGVHPRVIATKDDFDRIRELIKTDPAVAEWYNKLKIEADKCLTLPPFTFRTTDGLRMDTSVINRFETMGLVYNVEGGEQYVKKAYEDMSEICKYTDWQPGSFILTGNMMTAMAIGYDWFFNGLTTEQRKEIAAGIYKHGLSVALSCYRREVSADEDPIMTRAKLQWLGDTSNWTAVGNGGTAMAAIAIYDEYKNESIEALWNAFQSLENFYATTEPDGACTEGVGYWLYSRIYYIDMVAALQSALGTDYNRYTAGGIDKSGYFPIYMQNEAGNFMFSDGDGYIVQTPLYMYFAMRNQDNGLGFYRKNAIETGLSAPTVYDLIWYRAEFANSSKDMALDYYFRNVESGSFRNTFNNDFSTFLAFHGGSNNANHAHVDGGTWNFNAHGISWFFDLGKDPLTYTNLTGIQFTSDQLYRIRAEGHNCIVFNPSKSAGQSGIYAPVETFYSAESGGYGILDLSNVYDDAVTEYKRGFMLTDDRTRGIVQDKFKCKKPSEFYWFAHTRANISIASDGKSAVLTQDGRKLGVYLKSTNPDLKFEAMKAEPLPTSPNIIGQANNDAYRKLVIHGKDITECEIAVSLVPVVADEPVNKSSGALVPLDRWKITDKNARHPQINKVLMDGEEYGVFNPEIYEYSVRLPYEAESIPEIELQTDDNITVENEEYEQNLKRVVKYSVFNETGARKNYYFTFDNLPTDVMPEDRKPITVEGVTASEVIQKEYPPEKLCDGDIGNESRWTGLNDQWVKFDLGGSYEVDSFAISIYKGNERQNAFQVYASSDGENYELILDSANTRFTDGLELFRTKKALARYIKVDFHGADVSAWNSIKEIQIFGEKSAYSTITEKTVDFED